MSRRAPRSAGKRSSAPAGAARWAMVEELREFRRLLIYQQTYREHRDADLLRAARELAQEVKTLVGYITGRR